MEYLTVAAALRFAEEYSGSAVIVPCVNPDGVDIAVHGAVAAGVYAPFVASTGMAERWQANARGVDINHNFDAAWQCVKRRECAAGITAPCATRFGGCHAESEPETRALTALCRQRNPSRVLALHSQGREIYWDFGQHTPRQSLPLAQKMSEVSGYRVASPEPMATGGGFKDWFISRFHRCGFTVEMGLGQNPLPLRDFEAEYPLVKAILLTFLHGG
jgi:g-D-glutamyl-meso-diaminopimelate peptidase